MRRNRAFLSIVAVVAGFFFAAGCGGGGGADQAAKPAAQKPAETQAQKAPAKPATATISGTVTYAGTPPKNTTIKMDSDPQCSAMHSTPVKAEEYLVGAGGAFANCFVYIKSGVEGQSFPAVMDTVEFDQKGCEYYPHVFGMRTGQPLAIINSDPTLHNVHALPQAGGEFNLAMPKQGMRVTKTFRKQEVMVKIKCDVHSWMNAYVGVLDHPFFAVTGADGKFSIGPLPPGTYEVEVWHEKEGVKSMSVTVGDNETKAADFAFGQSGT